MDLRRGRAFLVHSSLLLLSVAGCDSKQAESPATPAATVSPSSVSPALSKQEATTLAQAALAPFKKELKETLTKALADGPAAAVTVCADVAPSLAQRASSERVTVGRSALRVRNPQNAPQAWLKPVLDELATLPSAEGQQRVVPLPKGGYGYAEAIVLQGPCLLCHGKDVAPQLAAQIRARYPSDQATGFEVGELRGVFWAEVAETSAQP